MFRTRIHDREAYRALFSFGGTLSNLDGKQVRNIPAAAENAREFAAEVINILKGQATEAAA